jgi:hypothetical protein
MTPSKFRRSLGADDPPEGLSVALTALWYGAKGEWSRAHELVMGETGADSAWVHAWLHRQEGDIENARHWYGRAGHSVYSGPPEDELGEILVELLTQGE